MSDYIENKKKLDKIRSKYFSKGDLLFKVSIQLIVEHGKNSFNDTLFTYAMLKEIDDRHDKAEAENKYLFMTRDFEKAIVECAIELASINTFDLLAYILNETYFESGEIGKPDYKRAIEIIRNCLCYIADCYGAYRLDKEETLDKFVSQLDLTDEEIIYFGWEELLEEEEEDC